MTSKAKFRAHPLYLVRNIGFWSLLALTTFLKDRTTLLFLSIACLFLLSVIRYKRFEAGVDEKYVVIKTGALFAKTVRIPINRISSVEILRYPADRIFSAVSVRLNTEAGRRGGDLRFVIHFSEKSRLISMLGIKKFEKASRFSFGQTLLLAAAASSAVRGIILVVPFFNKAGAVIGEQIPKLVFEQIENASRNLHYFERATNVLTLIFIFFYLCALAFYTVMYTKFKISSHNTHICVQYGVLTEHSIYINKSLVGGYVSAQTPLMLFLRRRFIKADVAHSNRRGGGNILLEPAVKIQSDNLLVKNKGISKKDFIIPFRSSAYRFFKFPFLIFSVSTLATLLLTQLFPNFGFLVLFFYCFLLLYVFLRVVYATYSCRNQKIALAETTFSRYVTGHELQEAHIFTHKVGVIKILRFPLDLKEKTCNVKITLRTKNAFTVRVKYLPFGQFCEQIDRTYKINE